MSLSIRFALISFFLLTVTKVSAADLVVDFMMSSGQQRTAWVKIIDQFANENPDVKIIHNEFPQEPYKRDFGVRLENQKVDIAFWFAGERLRQWAEKN